MNYLLIIIGVVIAVVVIGAVIYKLYTFINSSDEDKIEIIKSILFDLVREAEEYLGSETGQAKLKYVVSAFYSRIPYWITNLVSQDKLVELINEAVDELNEYIDNNDAMAKRLINTDCNK